MFFIVDDFFLEFEVFFEFDVRFIYGFCVDLEDVRKVVVDFGDLWLFCVLFEFDDFKGMQLMLLCWKVLVFELFK